MKAHKIMTFDEYRRLVIRDWHSVCYDYDGMGNVGIRYGDVAQPSTGGPGETKGQERDRAVRAEEEQHPAQQHLERIWEIFGLTDYADANGISIYDPAIYEHLKGLAAAVAERDRLRTTIKDTIEALERNSTSAPVVECLKAALSSVNTAMGEKQ